MVCAALLKQQHELYNSVPSILRSTVSSAHDVRTLEGKLRKEEEQRYACALEGEPCDSQIRTGAKSKLRV